ncbi:ACR, COG2135 domain protein, partial [Toxoplasma gondii FOU]
THAPQTTGFASEDNAQWHSVLKEGEAPLLFAGLFEDDASPGGRPPATRDCSATILTMDSANTPMADIHSRWAPESPDCPEKLQRAFACDQGRSL